MIEFYSNPRYSGNQKISIQKKGRIAFNASFVKEHNLDTAKFCYITKPNYEKKSMNVGFVFSQNPNLIPGINPFKLNLHSKSNRFQITPKSWFDNSNFSPEELEGDYVPTKKTDSSIGEYFEIKIELK